jgi:hypothetical protein
MRAHFSKGVIKIVADFSTFSQTISYLNHKKEKTDELPHGGNSNQKTTF